VANPGVAVLTESKRFPLTWDHLSSALPTWRRLLPQTLDPRNAPWAADDGWLLKSPYCNTGDSVSIRSLMTPRQWAAVRRAVWFHPSGWVAQRRFETFAVSTPMGEVFPCIGVFTINGHAAGAYARISRRPLIDYSAIDVALLVRRETRLHGDD